MMAAVDINPNLGALVGIHELRCTWIDGSSDGPTEWVPTLRIEPIPKAVQPLSNQILGGSVVEPRVELVDDTLVPDNLIN